MATNSAVGQGAVITDAGHLSIQNQTFNNFGQGGMSRPWSLREQLWFDEIKHRERVIDIAHEGTCTWLLQCHQYRLWATEPRTDWRHGLLWIKGNPGAGKSTIMKFAVDAARSQDSGELILPHFFNARGTQLEKSTEGMYRTLLVWLLDHLSEEACEHLRHEFAMGNTHQGWPIPELLRILKSAVDKIDPKLSTVFYIDALDECDQNEVRDMLRSFRGIMRRAWEAQKRIRICFASRPHPDTNYKDAIFVDLSEQPEHIGDMSRFIGDELDIGDSILADEVRMRVRRKAQGSFMWTRLVVHALNKEHHTGALGKLHQRLDEIPSDLHALYYYTLESYPEDRPEMLICFRWVHFTIERLTARELWWAIQLGRGRNTENIREEFGFHSALTMERYIVNITKGLAELRDGSCQFIHQSVADFIIAPEGLRYLFGIEDFEQFAAQSYELLKSCCEAELRVFEPRLNQLVARTDLRLGPNDHTVYDEFESEAPFLPHAAANMPSYADFAHSYGVNQDSFLIALGDRIGPTFVYEIQKRNDRLFVVHSLYNLLAFSDCSSILFDIASAPAYRAKELARSRGFHLQAIDVDEWLNWLVHVGYTIPRIKDDEMSALTNLLLHHRDRSVGLQLLLSELREAEVRRDKEEEFNWDTIDHDKMRDDSINFLDLARHKPALGIFVLLVFAPPETLEPHVESLRRCWATADTSYLCFLKTVLLFIKNQLKSDIVDFIRPGFIKCVTHLRDISGPEVQQISNQIIWLCATGLAT